MADKTEPTELSASTAESPGEEKNESIINPSSRAHLMTYLTKYGYDQDSLVTEEENFVASLKSFQEYGNLPITGKYDEATRTLMSQPRCGHPDLKKSNAVTGPSSFVNTGVRWNKTNLTYRIENFSPDSTPSKKRRAIADGFACWAAVTPLSFKEVDRSEDITIRFTPGRFGTGPTNVFEGVHGIVGEGYPGGSIYFDEAETWTQSFLALVAIHEIGHSLGLDHSNVAISTMAPNISTNLNSKLHPDDLHATHSIYGWREPRWMMIDAAKNPLFSDATEWTISILSTTTGLYKLVQDGTIWQYVGPPGPGFSGWSSIGLRTNPPAIELIGERNILYTRSKPNIILRYNVNIYSSWFMIDINPDCAQIACGGGEVYQRHFNAAKNYAAIFRYRGDNATPRWELIDDNHRTRQIDVDTYTLFQHHDNGSVWRYIGPGINWTLVSDQANASLITVGGNTVYWLQPTGVIWWDGRINPLDSNAETVSIFARGGDLYQVHKDRSLWRFSGAPGRGWEILDNNVSMELCAVNAEGDVYQMIRGAEIWRLAVLFE